MHCPWFGEVNSCSWNSPKENDGKFQQLPVILPRLNFLKLLLAELNDVGCHVCQSSGNISVIDSWIIFSYGHSVPVTLESLEDTNVWTEQWAHSDEKDLFQHYLVNMTVLPHHLLKQNAGAILSACVA